jgi:hypothetical protein
VPASCPIRAFASNRNQDSIASTQSLQHLLHIDIAAVAEPDVGFNLSRRVGVEHTLEIVGDEFDDLLTLMVNPGAACSSFMSPSPMHWPSRW